MFLGKCYQFFVGNQGIALQPPVEWGTTAG
jgi:hypothetical protein